MYKKVQFVATLLVACLALFATSQAQVDNLQNPSIRTPEQLKSDYNSLVYSAMVSRDAEFSVNSNNAPLYKILASIEEGITAYKEGLDKIQTIGVDVKDIVVKNGCENLKASNLFKVAEKLKTRMPEGLPKSQSARKQLEESLLSDPEIPYIVAEIKLGCEGAVRRLGIIKENSRKAADKVQKPIDELVELNKWLIAYSQVVCQRTAPLHAEYLREKLGLGITGVRKLGTFNGKSYYIGDEKGTAEIPEVVAPKNRRRDQ